MRVAVAQYNPTVGDVAGQVGRVLETAAQTSGTGVDLLVLPELYLVGYPPKDLLERRWFIDQVEEGIARIVAESAHWPEMGVLVGAPLVNGGANGKDLVNAAVLIYRGRVEAKVVKSLLPTYDVFDESRYFCPAASVHPVPFRGELLGIHVCEDAWNDPEMWSGHSPYEVDPIAALAAEGATLFVNISASPYSVGKESVRYRLLRNHAVRHRRPFLYVNQVGGNDELVFDGRSVALDAEGRPIAVLPSFEEALQVVDLAASGTSDVYPLEDEVETVRKALVLGLRDYTRKTGFQRAVLSLSGGIDSALTCVLAVEALGAENVMGITMPSQFSSSGSVTDSRRLAANLGIELREIPIRGIYETYLAALAPHFAGRPMDTAEENIQARIRGNLVMAFSNKFGHLLLSTGNKSEMAVGYSTLYGDMSGGLAVISDVPKTMVYALARHMNRDGEVIPQASIDKAPSAELRPNQTDQDTLPPYAVLDPILQCYVEDGLSIDEIVSRGYDESTVRWVVRAVDRNEFKRRQAAPGLKVTSKAFGFGRRMPIAARFSA